MRPTLIPNLLKNALFNFNHQERNQKLFELNKVYTRRKNKKLATEKLQLTALLTGKINPIHWKEKPRETDFFDVKGIAESILEIVQIENAEFQESSEPFYQPGMAADIIISGKFTGSFGKLDPKIAELYEIEHPIFLLDLCLEDLFTRREKTVPTFQMIPKYPSVTRDFSFIISKNIKYSEIEKMIYRINPKLIKKVVLFDEYSGKNIEDGFHSLALSVVYNSENKTFTDNFVNKLSQKIISKLKSEFKIEMR
jgi:phenylalanyl-tRNA synthetase beta chain